MVIRGMAYYCYTHIKLIWHHCKVVKQSSCNPITSISLQPSSTIFNPCPNFQLLGNTHLSGKVFLRPLLGDWNFLPPQMMPKPKKTPKNAPKSVPRNSQRQGKHSAITGILLLPRRCHPDFRLRCQLCSQQLGCVQIASAWAIAHHVG